jgi:hypothetical protein
MQKTLLSLQAKTPTSFSTVTMNWNFHPSMMSLLDREALSAFASCLKTTDNWSAFRPTFRAALSLSKFPSSQPVWMLLFFSLSLFGIREREEGKTASHRYDYHESSY